MLEDPTVKPEGQETCRRDVIGLVTFMAYELATIVGGPWRITPLSLELKDFLDPPPRTGFASWPSGGSFERQVGRWSHITFNPLYDGPVLPHGPWDIVWCLVVLRTLLREGLDQIELTRHCGWFGHAWYWPCRGLLFTCSHSVAFVSSLLNELQVGSLVVIVPVRP